MKNSRSRLTGFAGAASALALTLAACGGGAAEDQGDGGAAAGDGGGEPQEVTVGIVQLPIFAPIYVAEAKGYFEDEGLDVNLENVKSGQDAIPLAASGQIDVVAAGFAAGFFSAIDTGLEVTVVGSMGVTGPEGEDPASALVVSKELHDSGEITELADLKDRKIGVLGGGGATGAFFTASRWRKRAWAPTTWNSSTSRTRTCPRACRPAGSTLRSSPRRSGTTRSTTRWR